MELEQETGFVNGVAFDGGATTSCQPSHRGFLCLSRRFALVLSLLMMFVTFSGTLTPPRPAHAIVFVTVAVFLVLLSAAGGLVADSEVLKAWKDNIQSAIEWFGTVTGISKAWKAFKELFETKSDEKKSTKVAKGTATVTAVQGLAEATVRSQGVVSSNATNDLKTAAVGSIAQDTTIPPASEQVLCNLIIVRQLGVVMEPFMQMIRDLIKRSVMTAWMGQKAPGFGPGYAGAMSDMTCGKWDNGYDTKTGTKLSGYADDCRPTGTESDPGGGYQFEGADTRPPMWSTSLKVPDLSPTVQSVGSGSMYVTTANVDPEDYSEKRWLAAKNYCYRVAGGRPVYPYGEAMQTDEGKVAVKQYGNCAAIQEGFVDACSERVAYLTRPNCDNADMQGFCFVSVAACGAASASGTIPPGSFDNCRYGLSLYEALYLIDAVCMSGERSSGGLVGGVSHAAGSTSSDICVALHNSFMKLINNLDKEFAVSLKGAESLDGCWVEYNVSKQIAEAAYEKKMLAQGKDKNGHVLSAAAKKHYRKPVSTLGQTIPRQGLTPISTVP